MKLGILASTALVLTTTVFVAPAKAQRVCIVDNNNNVVCGRPATERDMERYNNSQSRQDRQEVARDINEIYQEVLGRRADISGLRTYTERVVEDDWSLDKVRRELARSQEAQQALNQIYREVLGRDIDPKGLETYRRNLEQGWSLEQVRRDVSNSQEARNRRQ